MSSIDPPGDHTILPPAPHGTSHHDQQLKGTLGVGAIIFMVVAAAAPLTAVGAAFPVAALLGNGVGSPTMTLVCGVLLIFVTVGLSTMATVIPRPGAFFTYIGHGLGRPSGLGAAWLAILTYSAVQIAVYALLGTQLQAFVVDTLGGPDVPWWVCTLAVVAIVGVLGFFHLELSAKVLGVVLVGEIGIVLLLSFVAVLQGGHEGLGPEPFEWENVASGSPALGLMFAIGSFLGFESAAIYRNEARDPARTIPRATYGAVALIALFYTFSQWALIMAAGPDRFPTWLPDHLGDFIIVLSDEYLGSFGAQVVNLLLITSLFACVLSFHNVIARYQHSMSLASALPTGVSRVHGRHRSPYVSSLLQTGTAALVLVAFVAVGLDPVLQVFTWLAGVAGFSVNVLLALTCLSVIAFLTTNRIDAGAWKTWIAPGIGLAGLVFILFVQARNFPLLLGEAGFTARVWFFYLLMLGFPVFGVLQALWLRTRRPAKYATVLETIMD
ncbi:APC family permease [Modestobacter sp. URMC 112]